MIRHSPSCMTVTHMASWPTTQRMLIPELEHRAFNPQRILLL